MKEPTPRYVTYHMEAAIAEYVSNTIKQCNAWEADGSYTSKQAQAERGYYRRIGAAAKRLIKELRIGMPRDRKQRRRPQ